MSNVTKISYLSEAGGGIQSGGYDDDPRWHHTMCIYRILFADTISADGRMALCGII